MSAIFDPYHKWLGILPKDQPPHHYRLLGLEPFEDDIQVIEAAADRQLGFLRKFQSGEHAIDCQKLLNEVSRARLCLLKPAAKTAYDQELKERLAKLQTAPPVTAAGAAPTVQGTSPVIWASAAAVIVAALGCLAFVVRGGGVENNPSPPKAVASNTATQPTESTPESTTKSSDAVTMSKSPPPASPPAKKGVIDILPLLKSEHILKGQWRIEKERLSSLHAKEIQGQVMLPIAPPKEYTIHVTGSRQKNSDPELSTLGIGLVCGPHDCMFAMETRPNGHLGLQLLDSRNWEGNETSIPGMSVPENVPFQLQAIVRHNNVEIRLDERTVVDWHGDFSRLSQASQWTLAGPHQLFFAAATPYVFTNITLGPPLPPRKLPGEELKIGDSVELLKSVDLKRDVWKGQWTRVGDTMISTPDSIHARFSVPYQVPEEYELIVEMECKVPGRGFYVGLPFQAGFAGVSLGNSRGISNSLLIDHGSGSRDQYLRLEKSFLTAPQNKIIATVLKNRIKVKVGNEEVFDWRGDPRRFQVWPDWATPGKLITVGSNESDHRIQSLKLTRLAPSADFSQPAVPTDGNLLAIVDVDRDTTHGYWKKTEKGIESSATLSSGLRFPAKLPANYEFRLVVECKSALEYFALGLPVGNRAVQMELDAAKGKYSGINWFEGKRSRENSTNTPQSAPIFSIGQLVTIQGRVEGHHLTVETNGNKLFDMNIPDTLIDPIWRLREGWLTPEERLQMSVNAWYTAYEIHEVRFRPLTPDSPPFPPMSFTPSPKPADPKETPGNPSATSAGTPQLPSAAAQAAALQQIREIFKNEYENAKKDSEKLGLIEKLEKVARDNRDNPAAKFVSLQEATKLAAELGDLSKAFALADEISVGFNTSASGLKGSAMTSAIPKLKGPQLNRDLFETAVSLIDELMSQEQFQAAIDLAGAVTQVAIKLKDKPLQNNVSELRKEADELLKDFTVAESARETLRTQPADPKANLTWGSWMCLRQNNWSEGLKLLQLAGDEPLKLLATRDLKTPSDQQEILQLGTDWLEFAKSQKDHSLAAFADRAVYWLSQARTAATGLKRSRIESLMEEAVKTRDWNSPMVYLLEAIDKKVSQRRYAMTAETSHKNGEPFQDLPTTGGILIGFNCRIGRFYQDTVVKAMQPVYATKLGLKLGDWHGEQEGELVEIRARDGYAISDIASEVGGAVDSIRLVFARVTRSGLDPKRSYVSEVIGAHKNPRTLVRGAQLNNHPIIGIFGHANEFWRGFGVIVAK